MADVISLADRLAAMKTNWAEAVNDYADVVIVGLTENGTVEVLYSHDDPMTALGLMQHGISAIVDPD